MRRTRRLSIASAIVLGGLEIAGLAARQAPPSSQQPPFRSATTLVEVDVIVRDGGRRFVEGLKADDFEVFEEGVPQQTQTLYVVEGTRVQPVGLGAGASAAAPLPSTLPATQRVLILFFDLEHLDQGSFKQLQPAAVKFVESGFQQGDIGGVLLGSTMAGNKLTPNKEELLTALRTAKPSFAATSRRLDMRDWPRMSQVEAIRIAINNDSEILSQVVRRAEAESAQTAGGAAGGPDLTGTVMEKARYLVSQARPAAGRTLKTMQALNTGLARVPGRKTVVFMSEGFMFDTSWGDLRALVAQAARANIRIYSIDALGLRRRDTSTDLAVMRPLETEASIPTDAYNTIEEGSNTLAVDTGGYVIRNTNDFAGALAEIGRDASHYYVIGYSPSNPVMDGKFRGIKVRVKRDGVEVRARRGYVAVPPAAPAPAGPARAQDAAGAPAPPAPSGRPSPAEAAAAATEPAPPVPAPSTAGAETAPPPVLPPAFALRPDTRARVAALAGEATNPGAAPTLAAEGWSEYGRGNLEGAERLLGQAASEPGAAPWVSYALGFAQFGLGKPKDAAVSWERVRVAVPEFEAVYLDLADAYLQLGEPGRAVDVLRLAAERWPANIDVLNALGTVQVKRGAVNDALATFKRALAADPKDALAYFNLGRTYELRYYQMRRFSRPTARWVDNPEDARKAIENYERYLAIGGPYEADARSAVERLRWR